jgi:hypothetical protein
LLFLSWLEVHHFICSSLIVSVEKSQVILICFAFIYDLLLLSCSFQYSFLAVYTYILTLISCGQVLIWSYMLGHLKVAFYIWMAMYMPRFGKFSPIILLNMLSVPLACTSSSMAMIHRLVFQCCPWGLICSICIFYYFSLSLSECCISCTLSLCPDSLSFTWSSVLVRLSTEILKSYL